MKSSRRRVLIFAALLIGSVQNTLAGSGFATRDLNPVLQPVYLPSRVIAGADDGWRINHSVFITNTLQRQVSNGESLIIDVENYRYELDLGYRSDHWITEISIPLVANGSGELDRLIDDWHSFFGFPDGERNNFPRDQILIEYQRDGIIEYSQTQSSSALGDIAIAIGYQVPDSIGYFVGIELPTGSTSQFSGNDSIDLAIWLAHEKKIDHQFTLFGMLGVSFPGDDGNLGALLADQIWISQLGFDYRFNDTIIATTQLDMHSNAVRNSDLRAFGESLQIQLGLGFTDLIAQHRLDVYFSEDILTGSAPDISFGLNLAREF